MEKGNGENITGRSNHRQDLYAPWYSVSRQPIVVVEHPFIIKDVDKGLATLGSPSKLGEVSGLHFSWH